MYMVQGVSSFLGLEIPRKIYILSFYMPPISQFQTCKSYFNGSNVNGFLVEITTSKVFMKDL
jgi:hypothetical protein